MQSPQKTDWTVGIVGGQNFDDWDYMVEQLKFWQDQHGKIVTIVSGGAKGADSLARNYSNRYLQKKPIEFLPDWKKYGKRAGAIRNAQIVQASQAVIAFPDPQSKGTWITVQMAKKKGLPVYICQKTPVQIRADRERLVAERERRNAAIYERLFVIPFGSEWTQEKE